MATSPHPPTYRPGALRLFLLISSVVVATVFWTWLVILAVDDGALSMRHVLAAAGASTSTVVAALLAVQETVHRDVAERHADLRRLLVDISWNAFAAAGNAGRPVDVPDGGNVVPFRTASSHDPKSGYGPGSGYDRPRGG